MYVKVLPQRLDGFLFGKKFIGKTKNVVRRSRVVAQLESLSRAIGIVRWLDRPSAELILKPHDCGIFRIGSFHL